MPTNAVAPSRRHLRRWLALCGSLLVSLGVASWANGCSSFSGTDTGAGGDGGDAALEGSSQPTGDAVAPGSDGAAPDGGGAGSSLGCAVIKDAAACFDFDSVDAASQGWSSVIAATGTSLHLSTTAYSNPYAAHFELAVTDAAARPTNKLSWTNGALAFPASVEARMMVPAGGAVGTETALVVTFAFNSAVGGNAVDLLYSCTGSSCTLVADVYSKPDDASVQGLTKVACGTFPRGAFIPLSLSLAPNGAMQQVTCSAGGDAGTASFQFAPAASPHWEVGATDQNLPVFGGQVVLFDDVVFR